MIQNLLALSEFEIKVGGAALALGVFLIVMAILIHRNRKNK